jgi:hypothetical protein
MPSDATSWRQIFNLKMAHQRPAMTRSWTDFDAIQGSFRPA